MSDYFNNLLSQAFWRDLTEREINAVVAELETEDPDEDPYILLAILGYCCDKQYIPLVERYANGPHYHVAGEAIWVLCYAHIGI